MICCLVLYCLLLSSCFAQDDPLYCPIFREVESFDIPNGRYRALKDDAGLVTMKYISHFDENHLVTDQSQTLSDTVGIVFTYKKKADGKSIWSVWREEVYVLRDGAGEVYVCVSLDEHVPKYILLRLSQSEGWLELVDSKVGNSILDDFLQQLP